MALRADERRDKLRKASGRSKYPTIRRYLNGETWRRRPPSLHTESIGMQREPGELKHLSSRRKRKQHVIPGVAASETGRAQTGVRAHRGYGPQQVSRITNRTVWEVRPKRVKVSYVKVIGSEWDPEYRETRGTLREVGGTTPQG